MIRQHLVKTRISLNIFILKNLLIERSKRLKVKITIGIFLSIVACSSYAQSHYAHPHWIGLFPADFFESYVVGENRNELGQWELEVYSEPDASSELLGLVKIVFAAETGFTAEFEELETGTKFPIQPHLFDPDYGYGPYFHLTIAASKNGFYRIKLNDSDETHWAHFESAFGQNNVAIIQLIPGMILMWENNTGKYDDIIIEHVDSDSLVVRPEQAVDMWCGDESLRYEPYSATLMPRSDWTDGNGISRFYIPYTRGC